ncbi:MAG TPA: UGSC family (seleno)protein [Streptosporangiaceae bacterium]
MPALPTRGTTPGPPYIILDPTGTLTADQPGTPNTPRARRRTDLHGVTVGLLVNTKQNAAPFLDEVGRLLIERYGAQGTMARTKVNFAAPADESLVKEMAASCDVIITGIGDCGSCSASAVADGIAFESAGLPAAAICSDAFRVTADAMAGVRGAPGYRYATTPHPVAVLTPDQVKERAAGVLDDVVALLTEA